MSNKLKKPVFFLLILTLFSVKITGVLLFWHIAMAGGFEHHDSSHCSICQKEFINSAKIISISPVTTIYINIVAYAIDYESNDPLTTQSMRNTMPRAPPA